MTWNGFKWCLIKLSNKLKKEQDKLKIDIILHFKSIYVSVIQQVIFFSSKCESSSSKQPTFAQCMLMWRDFLATPGWALIDCMQHNHNNQATPEYMGTVHTQHTVYLATLHFHNCFMISHDKVKAKFCFTIQFFYSKLYNYVLRCIMFCFSMKCTQSNTKQIQW